MRKFYLLISFLGLVVPAMAQTYGNEWIVSGQSYLKVPVTQKGVYRVTRQQLQQAGWSGFISSLDPRKIQVFRNGTEVPVWVKGENDGSFDAGDELWFYGYPNDGALDTRMYVNPTDQPSSRYSLYTDSAFYFITFSATQNGMRFTDVNLTNYSGFTPEAYFMHHEWVVCNEKATYDDGPTDISFASYSDFTRGEGWVGNWINIGKTQNRDVNSPNYYASGPAPYATFTLFGRAYNNPAGISHYLNVKVGPDKTSPRNALDTAFAAYDRVSSYLPLQSSDIGTSTTRFSFSVPKLGTLTVDNQALSEIQLVYPRSFDLSNQSQFYFSIQGAGAASNTYVKWSNYPTGKNQPWMFDLTSQKRIQVTLAGTDLQALIPGHGLLRDVFLFDESDIQNTTLMPVYFPSINLNGNANFIIITHPDLSQGATAYANYRNATGYQVLTVFTRELYDYFYYGQHHPMAIRNFVGYLLSQASAPPKYLLLLGKGREVRSIRQPGTNGVNYTSDLVPTWGSPPSDILLTCGLNGQGYAPSLLTGRLSAKNNQQILDYLDKLNTYESSLKNNASWHKTVMHLSGGKTKNETARYRGYLDYNRKIVEGPSFGGTVKSHFKDDALVVSDRIKQNVIDDVNAGTAFLHYYGHGAADILEVDIGYPFEYNNQGKYPVMFFAGCTLGNYFGESSLGEKFIFEPNKGAVGWYANSSLGFEYELKEFSQLFYKRAFQDDYGKPFGEIQINTILAFQDTTHSGTAQEQLNAMHCKQILFLGDPALTLYSPKQPDFVIKPELLSVYPEKTIAVSDSFAIQIVMQNLGKRVPDSINIQVTRKFPDQTVKVYPAMRVLSPGYSDTVYFWIKSKDIKTKGINQFTVFIDSDNEVNEPDNFINNTATFDFFMPSNGVDIIYPYKYAIVSDDYPRLEVQSTNVNVNSTEYVFEIDTNFRFNSPAKQTWRVAGGNQTYTYPPKLTGKDSTVYYWRVKLNIPDTQGGTWSYSTFYLIRNSPEGWANASFPQFYGVTTDHMNLDTTVRQFRFTRTTGGRFVLASLGNDLPFSSGLVNSNIIRYNDGTGDNAVDGNFGNNVLAILAVNPDNLTFFNYAQSTYNAKNKGVFRFDLRQQADADSFIAHVDKIPDGYRVYVVKGYDVGLDKWTSPMFLTMEKLGAGSMLKNMNPKYPYCLMGTKGAVKGTAIEATADTINSSVPGNVQQVALYEQLTPLDTVGSITSEIIGPSKGWVGFFNRKSGMDNPADSVTFSIIPLDKSGTPYPWMGFNEVNVDTLNISKIDATQYPFLQVKATFNDSKLRTTSQLDHWIITYLGVPEASVMTTKQMVIFKQDSVQEGDSAYMKIAFRNTSRYAMDSVLTVLSITNAFNQETELFRGKLGALPVNDTIFFEYKIPTKGRAGLNKLNLSFNPDYDQPEQFLYNNVWQRSFFVVKDDQNPLLDVVFDGVRISDNDYVSANPNIVITVTDENKSFFIRDTSNLDVQWMRPGQTLFEKISFGNGQARFIPASSSNKTARVEFNPHDLPDGTYTLKVQAFDPAGNKAGAYDYVIRFRVNSKPSVTHFYPYPNPAVNAMKFVFTLRGSEVPDHIHIQIMTLAGTVVRDITKADLGNVHIGDNISDFTWDGTDQFGDRLANGVYFYRVRVRNKGQDIPLVESENDVYFKNGIGKIYLMR